MRSCPFSTMRLVVTLCPLTISVDDITDLNPELPAPEPPKEVDEKVVRLAPPARPRASKAEKASMKAGNSPKPAEKAPRSPGPRPARSLLKGASQKSNEKGSRPPKNSRKMSSGFRKV
uniref:DnaJ heat shock protein family (Hsp40) member B8 n=3 Tax=Canis lupus TaxID=9612 RepID=A0A8C0Z7I7_CANLF